jgi:zinc transport system substrate-binding protein
VSPRVISLLAAASLVLVAGACSSDKPAASSGKTNVVVAFYPLQFLAERIGGDQVTVTNLTKPGAEPHDLELAPQQVSAIQDAGLVLYLAGFQPAVDEAIDQEAKDHALDVATVQPLNSAPPGAEEESGGEQHANEGMDPHVWLDPVRFAAIADKVADRLVALDTAHAADFRTRLGALKGELTKLDGEFRTGLATCVRRDIVTSHAAFGYLAQRYNLTQIPITGLNPDEDPGPQRLQEVAALAKQKGVTTIFFETLVSPKISETLAKEVGAKAEVLDPIEGIEPGSSDDYLSVMRTDLATLRGALGCS